MLDELEYIARFDPQNALGIAAGQPEHLLYETKFTAPTLKGIQNVVLTGMGGSALAGLLFRSWVGDKLSIPFVVTRDYALPGFVSAKTLVIASSYSGNTEETLTALAAAEKKGAKIVAMTSGSKLAEQATKKKYPHLLIPEGLQPRMATWYGLKLLASLFQQGGLLDGLIKELEAARPFLAASARLYVPQEPTKDNLAKQLAENLMGKSVIIYGGPTLASVAYKWKIGINESGKNLAFCNELPELDHNEIVGWTSHPIQKPYAVIELQSSFDDKRISKRFAVSNRLLSGKMPRPLEIEAQGPTKIAQILWAAQLGEFVGTYLGILNGVNPTPVAIIEKLKKEL